VTHVVRFSFPTTVLYGFGAIRQLPLCLDEVGIEKPLLVTDRDLTKTDAFTTVETVLQKSKTSWVLFSDVHPNPLLEDVEAAVEVYKKNKNICLFAFFNNVNNAVPPELE